MTCNYQVTSDNQIFAKQTPPRRAQASKLSSSTKKVKGKMSIIQKMWHRSEILMRKGHRTTTLHGNGRQGRTRPGQAMASKARQGKVRQG